MWNRIEIKQKARKAVQYNFWKTFFSSLLMLIFTGSTSYYFANDAIDTIPDTIRTILHPQNSDYKVIAVIIVLFVSLLVISTFIKTLFSIFIKNPVQVGFSKFLYKTIQAKDMNDPNKGQIADNFWAFDHNYLNIIKVMFVKGALVTLGYLCFVIPGIYLFYSYRMLPFILSENPDLSVKEALETSKAMMNGHKKDMLMLDLSFIPWHIIGVLTLGIIEILNVYPYINLTIAESYRVLSKQYYGEEN